jgi:hypothetical protein
MKRVADLAFRNGTTVGMAVGAVFYGVVMIASAASAGEPVVTGVLFVLTMLQARVGWKAWQRHRTGMRALG